MLQNLATRLFYDVKYKHLVQAIANVNVAGVAFLKQVLFSDLCQALKSNLVIKVTFGKLKLCEINNVQLTQ